MKNQIERSLFNIYKTKPQNPKTPDADDGSGYTKYVPNHEE
jgi:hypothetical protein